MVHTLLGNGHDERRHQHQKLGYDDIDIDSQYADTPIRFLRLSHVCSATSPCSGSSNVFSKKIQARKLPEFDAGGAYMEEEDYDRKGKMCEERLLKVIRVYSRRRQKKSFSEVVTGGDEIVVRAGPIDEGFDGHVVDFPNKKRRAPKWQNWEVIRAWFVLIMHLD